MALLFVSITKRIETYFVMPSIIECRLGAITKEIIEPMLDDFFKNTQLPEHHFAI
jgi:hypothetical protein